jgi:cystathionine beta-lyase/cystathionine gamma-synthase
VAGELLGSGAGGMLAFEIAGGGRAEVFRFLERVKLARPAPTLGDVATLVMHPATAAARRMTPEERAQAGITENLVRVSVGLEDPEDIAGDLLQAVEASRGRR